MFTQHAISRSAELLSRNSSCSRKTENKNKKKRTVKPDAKNSDKLRSLNLINPNFRKPEYNKKFLKCSQMTTEQTTFKKTKVVRKNEINAATL